MGAQIKYADRRNAPCVVIQGGDEKAKGEIQIKDLILGAEIAGLSQDRDDYLTKQARGAVRRARGRGGRGGARRCWRATASAGADTWIWMLSNCRVGKGA